MCLYVNGSGINATVTVLPSPWNTTIADNDVGALGMQAHPLGQILAWIFSIIAGAFVPEIVGQCGSTAPMLDKIVRCSVRFAIMWKPMQGIVFIAWNLMPMKVRVALAGWSQRQRSAWSRIISRPVLPRRTSGRHRRRTGHPDGDNVGPWLEALGALESPGSSRAPSPALSTVYLFDASALAGQQGRYWQMYHGLGSNPAFMGVNTAGIVNVVVRVDDDVSQDGSRNDSQDGFENVSIN